MTTHHRRTHVTDDLATHLRITHHGRDAMDRRGITLADVYRALTTPEVVEPSGDRHRFVRDGFAYVIDWEYPPRREPRVVLVTVVLRSRETWTDADARARRVAP